MISKIIFLFILALIFALFDIYFYKRLTSFFTHNKKTKRFLLLGLLLWQFGFAALMLSSSMWEIRPLFASVLGFMLFAVVFGVALEFLRLFRYFDYLKYVSFAVFAAVFAYSFYSASQPPVVKKIAVAVADKRLVGMRLAVVADIHIDPSKKEFANAVVERINKLDADVVLIVGDLFDGNIEELEKANLGLDGIKSRYGVFFAPGNHEYYYDDFEAKMRYLESVGIKPLVNGSENIGGVSFVGLSDPAAVRVGREGPDAKKAFLGAQTPSILLAHQPKTALGALAYSPTVVFCGHTHDGQIWPFKYLVSLAQPFLYGRYTEGGSQIIVTSGVGLWGPPMRLWSECEILEVTLSLG